MCDLSQTECLETYNICRCCNNEFISSNKNKFYCGRECQKKVDAEVSCRYRKNNRKNNPVKARLTNAKRRRFTKKVSKEWLINYKKSKCCQKCGEDRWFCLDFHHLDSSVKKKNVSALAEDGYSPRTIEAEINKCVILCNNCHRHLHILYKRGLDPEQTRQWLNDDGTLYDSCDIEHFEHCLDYSKMGKKDKINAKRRVCSRQKREWLNRYKQSKPCQVCGENRWFCLNFHHMDSKNKEMEISNFAGSAYSKKRILAEIKKCIILCSNCHRHLHFDCGKDLTSDQTEEWLKQKCNIKA